ncbi:MAG: energy transducer TonB [Bacteroidia bacterium]|nr:energy transducer TonB [Bacteroidia bacterium]
MAEYIKKNLRFPKEALLNSVRGLCVIRFVVDENGRVSDAVLFKGIPDCKECNDEALRVVKSFPDWIPAEKNQKKVKSVLHLPIRFESR